jgi:sugar transferase (PEP-CTERM/EpsH1 system associated)
LENGVVNLVNRMPPDAFRHGIVCLAGFTEFRHRIQRDDVSVCTLDKQPGKDFGAYWRFWRLLRHMRPDIVHTRNIGTVDLQWLAWLAGVKGRVHGEHGWGIDDVHGLGRRSLLIRRVCRHVIGRYVAVSRDIARWLQQAVGAAPARITQIYNGVDTDRFTGEGIAPPDVPWRNDLRRDLIVFGTVGRLDPIKNQRALLDAFGATVAATPDGPSRLRLVIVGDGPSRKELQLHARDLKLEGLIWFAGARDDIPDLLCAMDVFVLPSLNEGISNTLLEAMASARAVIAANVGGNSELIRTDQCGILYDPRDPNALATAMQQLAATASRRVVYGRAARSRAIERFGLRTMVERYTALYEQLSVV